MCKCVISFVADCARTVDMLIMHTVGTTNSFISELVNKWEYYLKQYNVKYCNNQTPTQPPSLGKKRDYIAFNYVYTITRVIGRASSSADSSYGSSHAHSFGGLSLGHLWHVPLALLRATSFSGAKTSIPSETLWVWPCTSSHLILSSR